MCAKCGCGCKSGKPEKNCKCGCPTCKEARNSKHESEESEYEDEDEEVEKAAYTMTALRGLQESFKAGKQFGRAGVKNAMSPYGKNKVKTAGFRAGSAAGRTGKFVSENPGKSALIAGGAVGAGVAANKAIKKSAFGVDMDYISKADQSKNYTKGNTIAGYFGGGYYDAFKGKKGQKLNAIGNRAVRSSLGAGAGLAGGAATGAGIGALAGKMTRVGAGTGAKIGAAIGGYGGALTGTAVGNYKGVKANQAAGRYKVEKSFSGVSAFGVQH